MFVLSVQLRPGAYRAGRPLMQSAPPEPPPTQQNPDAPSSPGRSDLGLSGPLEDGFRELMPFVAQPDDGNVDPSIVERMEREVKELTGVDLEDLLNPSKVVNLELERLKLEAELADFGGDAEEREKLEAKLDETERKLYTEKRTVFAGWLKGLFIGQALIAVVLSGYMVYDAFPTVTLDISLQALGFWSYWLFIIPSLRARRPRGWEKQALNWAFLGSPLLTIGLPFVARSPPLIWNANLALLIGAYAYAFLNKDAVEGEVVGGFSGALRWLDFGSGQERGMRADKREAYEQQQREAAGEDGGGGGLPFGLKLPEMPKDFDWDAEIELPGVKELTGLIRGLGEDGSNKKP